jgi:hypothetical protein
MSNQYIEHAILRHLWVDLPYASKYLPHLKKEYFKVHFGEGIFAGDVVFTAIASYIEQYHACPSKTELLVEIRQVERNSDEANEAVEVLDRIEVEPLNPAWLEDQTTAFITNKYHYDAVMDLVNATENGKPIAELAQKLLTPPMLTKAVPGLDTRSADFLTRLCELNQQKESLIPFDIDMLNRAVRGVRRKTLNIILAGTGVGKSLTLCHFTAGYMLLGLNVLYLSMEMDDLSVQNRVNANLLDIAVDELESMPIADVLKKASTAAHTGRLIVHDYPTGSAHTGHFRSYLAELKDKSSFVPDVIVVDYLNICSSERTHLGGNTPQYVLIGSIAKRTESAGAANKRRRVVCVPSEPAGFERAMRPVKHIRFHPNRL